MIDDAKLVLLELMEDIVRVHLDRKPRRIINLPHQIQTVAAITITSKIIPPLTATLLKPVEPCQLAEIVGLRKCGLEGTSQKYNMLLYGAIHSL